MKGHGFRIGFGKTPLDAYKKVSDAMHLTNFAVKSVFLLR